MGLQGHCVPTSPGQRAQGIRGHPRISSLRTTGPPSGQMFRQHHGKGRQPSRSTMENSCQNEAAMGARGRGTISTSASAQSAKNSSTRRYGLRALVGRIGGFLKNPPAGRTGGIPRIISGAGQKRKNIEEGKPAAKKPRGGP